MGCTAIGESKTIVLVAVWAMALLSSCGSGRPPRFAQFPQLQWGIAYPLDLTHLSYPVERLTVYSSGGQVQLSANDTYTFTPQQTGPVDIQIRCQGQLVEVLRFWVTLSPQP